MLTGWASWRHFAGFVGLNVLIAIHAAAFVCLLNSTINTWSAL